MGNGGHARQLIAEGCSPKAKLIAIGSNEDRKKEAEARKGWDGQWDTFFSFSARSFGAIDQSIGEGSQVLSGAIIGPRACISAHTIVNCQAVVHHDAKVGMFAHIAPGAQVLGGAVVGEGVLVGANAVIMPLAVVPDWVIVRACSVYPNDYKSGRFTLKRVRHDGTMERCGWDGGAISSEHSGTDKVAQQD